MNEAKKIGALLAPGQQPSDLFLGTVVSVDYAASPGIGSSLTVDVRGGEISGVRYLSHVTPRPGYSVVLQRLGRDVVAVGSLAQLGVPACRVRRDANGTAYGAAGAAIQQTVTFDTEIHDPWNMWTSGTNVVIPIPGLYDLSGNITFTADGTGFREVSLQLNGTTVVQDRRLYVSAGTPAIVAVATEAVPCQAGDLVTLQGGHSATSNLQHLGGAQARNVLSVKYAGPLGP